MYMYVYIIYIYTCTYVYIYISIMSTLCGLWPLMVFLFSSLGCSVSGLGLKVWV